MATIPIKLLGTRTISSGLGASDWHGRASIKRRADGALVLTYRTGSGHAVNDGALHIRFSDDEGRTWTAEDTTLGGGAVAGFPMNPAVLSVGEDAGEPWLMVAPNGDLLLHMWRVDYGVTLNGTWQARSTDGGESWTAATQVLFSIPGIDDGWVFATDDDFVLDGVIYAGARVYGNGPAGLPTELLLIASPDNGLSWHKVSTIMTDAEGVVAGQGAQEVGLEYLGGDRILAMIRDNGHVASYQRVSTDLGLSWGQLVDVTATVGIAGRQRVYTRAHLKGEAEWWNDPVLIMVGFVHQDPPSSQGRQNAIWISRNRGDTWEGPHFLDATSEDGGYGDAFYDRDADEWAVVSYYGTLTTAALREYRVAIAFPVDDESTAARDTIEAWVTEPDGTYIAHLDRSPSSPFRNFRFYRERAKDGPGGGSLEYHLDNRLVRDTPGLFAKGNLVWMRYRGRTVVWIVEEDTAELTAAEHGSDWVAVAGAGAVQLLADRIVLPPDFAAGNLNPATWATQWRSFLNRAAGELLWDLIAESNARFATQILRGTVESTGADGISIDYRFENLLTDVLQPIVEAEGSDVVMDGLTFNYYVDPGVDRSGEVIFEEGADVLGVKVTTSEREALSWVVGEGVGEGVFAKLAVAERAASRRREAFLAAKEAGNVPLLQLMTDAALDEHAPVLGLEVNVSEDRYRAFVDFDLHDDVRVIAPSRGVDQVLDVAAIYVGEEGDQVRVDLDLGLVREDDELRLDRQLRETRRSLGVRNRQPQGQLVPINANGADVFDDADTMDVLLWVLDEVYVLVRAKVTLVFREFFTSAAGVASGGGATSGASSTSTSASGGSSTPTTSNYGDAHNHQVADFVDSTPPALTKRQFQKGAGGASSLDFNLETAWTDDWFTTAANTVHNHTVTIGAHTHGIAHDHSVPAHTHALDYGVFKEAMPASHDVTMAIYKRNGASWDLVVSISGLTDDVEELDVTPYVTGPGLWRFSLQSAPGQPNGGRLAADVAVAVLGAIQSA